MVVGITGPSGAGKGLVVGVFESHGFRVVDADKVAREVVMPGEPALYELSSEFGGDIINADGTLNRRLLANRAFASRENTDRMNDIMLNVIRRRMIDRADEFKIQRINCVFDAPLLFEAGLEECCDCCVAVIAPIEIRINRLAKRDCITEEEIRMRIEMQHNDEYYTSRCQYVIINDKGKAELEKASDEVVKDILRKDDRKKW